MTSPKSLRTIIIITLVTATSLVMMVFGGLNYYREYRNARDKLNASLDTISSQMSAGIHQPLLTGNIEGIVRVVESFMQLKFLYGVTVSDNQKILVAVVRDDRWQLVPTHQHIASANFLYQKRNLISAGKTVGTLEIYITPRFIRTDLRQDLVMKSVYFGFFLFILIGVLFLLLMKTVMHPMKSIEDYAFKVSQADWNEMVYMPYMRLPEEMANLKLAIERMVERHHARYLELNSSQMALRDTEAKYRNIFYNANEGIFQVAPDGRMLTANPALAQILGYTSVEELLRTYKDPPANIYSDQAKIKEILSLIKRHGQVKDYEYTARRKDETPIITLIDAHVIRDPAGKVMYYEGLLRDITERKRMDDLRIAKETAEKTAQSKNQFLANISHEIRTPMNAIIGFSNLALQNELSPKLRNYLNTIAGSARSLLRLINDILDFSKIEAEHLEMESVNFSLRTVIDGTSELIELKAKEKGITFAIFLSPNIPDSLIGDPLRLGQVLLNLASNAVKFTSSGHVFLRVDALEITGEYCQLCFSVEDTGIGMTEEHLSNLFKPFSQADSSITRRFGGTGLGLAICKHLVEMMGGRIQVQSKTGEGSTFSFAISFVRSLPGNQFQPDTPRVSSDYTAWKNGLKGYQPIRDARILLVEDNVINQELATEILKEIGLHVEIANNGKEALAYLNQSQYDLILMDVQLPVMSGLETTVLIRENDLLKDIPIVAMTAHDTAQTKRACLAAGMNDYITKPLDIDLLLSVLIKWLAPLSQTNEEKTVDSLPDRYVPSIAPDVSAALPGIDFAGGLMRLQGNRRLYMKLLDAFLIHQATAGDAIAQMIQNGDHRTTADKAHSIKGAAANLSLVDVAESARQLEEAARNGDTQALTTALQDLETKIAVVRESVRSLSEAAADHGRPHPTGERLPPDTLSILFQELYLSLKHQDLRAIDQFDTLKKQLLGGAFDAQLDQMDHLLTDLDFVHAQDAVHQLAEKFNITLGGKEN